MSLKDFFKKKKVVYEQQNINLDDDIYIDEEMKTFNPEQNDDNEIYDDEADETTLVTTVVEIESTNLENNVNFNFVKRDVEKVDLNRVNFAPKNYNDIQSAALMLQSAKQVLISLENMSAADRSKTLNFFAGMIFALNGDLQRVDKNLYFFTVNNN